MSRLASIEGTGDALMGRRNGRGLNRRMRQRSTREPTDASTSSAPTPPAGWHRLVDPDRPVMRSLTFGATLVALIGSASGLILWRSDGDQRESPTNPSAHTSPTSNSLPNIDATIGDCTEETASTARELELLRVDDIVELDLRAPQGRVFATETPSHSLAEAASGVSAEFHCAEEFPPALIINAENLEGRGGWAFEHGEYLLIGTFALQQSGIGTGGGHWYQFRQVRPEDLT